MKRVTRCLTYGEPVNQQTVRMDGAVVHFADYVTLCGREDNRPIFVIPPVNERRPRGVCPACFRAWWHDYAQSVTAEAAFTVAKVVMP